MERIFYGKTDDSSSTKPKSENKRGSKIVEFFNNPKQMETILKQIEEEDQEQGNSPRSSQIEFPDNNNPDAVISVSKSRKKTKKSKKKKLFH